MSLRGPGSHTRFLVTRRRHQLSDEDTLPAICALRVLLHGFITLEAAGGYAMELDLDESCHQMITCFDAGHQLLVDDITELMPLIDRLVTSPLGPDAANVQAALERIRDVTTPEATSDHRAR